MGEGCSVFAALYGLRLSLLSLLLTKGEGCPVFAALNGLGLLCLKWVQAVEISTAKAHFMTKLCNSQDRTRHFHKINKISLFLLSGKQERARPVLSPKTQNVGWATVFGDLPAGKENAKHF